MELRAPQRGRTAGNRGPWGSDWQDVEVMRIINLGANPMGMVSMEPPTADLKATILNGQR